MRLSGIASGMDTDSMIQELMRAERTKVDKVAQEKQVAEWKQNAYNDLNKELANFILGSKEDLGLLSKNSVGASFNSSYKNATWVKSVVAENESRLTATATTDSMNGTHSIKMKELAEGVSAVSNGKITKTGGPKDFIANQLDGFGKDDVFEITVGGSKGNVTFIIGNDGTEGSNKKLDSDGVNNIIRLDKKLSEVSLKDIANMINNASVNEVKDGKVVSTDALGVQAGYDEGLDKFFIKTKNVGADATLSVRAGSQIEDGVDNAKGKAFIEALGLGFGKADVKPSKLEDGTNYSGTNLTATSSEAIGYGGEGKHNIFGKLSLVDIPGNKFDININGKNITINNESTINGENSIIEQINAVSSETGVFASFSDGKLMLSTGDTNGEIKISSQGTDKSETASKSFIESLKLEVNSDEIRSTYKGTNAVLESYKVDGVEFIGVGETVEYSSNNFTINGVNFSAKSVEEASSVTIGSDTDAIFDKVKEFVEGYNKIIDEMNKLVGEKSNRNFKPLTNDEREAMSDKEIELWESKAKSGLLRSDEVVSRNLQNVRSGLYDDVKGTTGSYNHITNIGISTEKYVSGSMGGKLVIDELDLRKAIENDAAGVMDLLFKQPTGNLGKDDADLTPSEISEKRSQSGIVTRIYDNLAAGMKEIVDKSGLGNESDIIRKVRGKITSDFVIKGSQSIIDKQITEFNQRMDSLNKFLYNKEESYYRRFAAMEQAMQRSNAQSSWLMQQMGGGGQ